MVPIKRYTGDFSTQIRLRFKFGNDNIMTTNSFNASIDPTQFEKETENVRGILFNGPANYFSSE